MGDLLRSTLADGPQAQIHLARYVLQWNLADQRSDGADPQGDYRERFEAWLAVVRELALTPVLSLTSYDEQRPASPADYARALAGVLRIVRRQTGAPIWLEPWNEPNDQGRMTAHGAADLADAAAALCDAGSGCGLIAGDFLDDARSLAYERAYERALDFNPAAWGIHPYVAVAERDDATALALRAGLPAGARLWITEVGALYCDHGEVLGQHSQATGAEYLLAALIPALAPVHVIYYGLLAADGLPARCDGAFGGQDSELYAPGDLPRLAARVLLAASTPEPSAPFGPAPGLAGGLM